MSKYTDREVAGLLKAQLPPKIDEWMLIESGDGGLGDLVDAVASEANADAFALAERATAQSTPATATSGSGRLVDWEAALGLSGTRIAQFSSDAGRVAQVLAQTRAGGTPTVDAITAALAAVTGNVAAITILEHDRAALTVANMHSFGSITTVVGNATTTSLTIGDNAPCSPAGVRLMLSLSGGDVSAFTVELVGPDATGYFATPLHVDGSDYVYFMGGFAGAQVDGEWRLFCDNTAGAVDVQIDAADLFVEGIGRNVTSGAEGMGAPIFTWTALINTALTTPGTYSVEAARAVVRAMNPAHCRAYLAQYNGAGGMYMRCDDPLTPCDGGVCS